MSLSLLLSPVFFFILVSISVAQQEDESILLSWVSSNPGIQTTLTVAKSQNYRTLITTQPLRSGEVALEIPLSRIYSAEIIFENTPFGDKLKEIMSLKIGLGEMTVLAIGILHEKTKGTSSPLYAYISTLPKTFSTPLFFTPEDFKLAVQLYREPIFEDLRKGTEILHRQFKIIDEKIFKVYPESFPNEIDFQLFKWAIACVTTRSWRVRDHDVIIPFSDMANHDPSASEPQIVNENFVFQASRDYKEGEEFAVSYGNLSDWETFSRYGFVSTVNPHNYLEVEFGSPNTTIWEKLVQDINHFLGFQDIFRIKPDGSWEPDHCLHRVRVSNLSPVDFPRVSNIAKGMLISLKNEQKSLNSLIKLLNQFLQKYSTTVQEDQERLKNPYLSTTQKNLILYFAKQKIMLNHASVKIHQSWLSLIFED